MKGLPLGTTVEVLGAGEMGEGFSMAMVVTGGICGAGSDAAANGGTDAGEEAEAVKGDGGVAVALY